MQGVGSWPGFGDPYEYTGGIAAIDPETYLPKMVVDDDVLDGEEMTHPCGAVRGMAIASTENGYFVGYNGWGDNTLYRFNPTTGDATQRAASG